MQGTYMMVLEVSQKQAYIFNEKRLHNNIVASDTIAYVTSSAFFKKEFSNLYDETDNLIYSGGGHTFLFFKDHDSAYVFAKAVSKHVLEKLPGLELFIKMNEYDTDLDPEQNLTKLLNSLEKKKGVRKGSFYQTSFGIEQVGNMISVSGNATSPDQIMPYDAYREEIHKIMKSESSIEICPEGYIFSEKLQDLGGTKDKSNFIAVIHIDGNQMGARVASLKDIVKKKVDAEIDSYIKKGVSQKRSEFEIWRSINREFSEAIDRDFKESLKEVYQQLKNNLDEEDGIQSQLSLKTKEKKKVFPLRKIIAAGDDICFITEGRIGIEAAALFLHNLEKKINKVDGKGYHACAGVAIVHQKYPFYRAYDLAEQLCSNAKKEMAQKVSVEEIGSLSAIDWHVEYGEMVGDLEEIRDRMIDMDKKPLYARPYQVTVKEKGINPTLYSYFKQVITTLNNQTDDPLFQHDIARNKVKSLRSAVKRGKEELYYYSKVNFIPEILTETISSGELFDVLETMDVFLPLKGGN